MSKLSDLIRISRIGNGSIKICDATIFWVLSFSELGVKDQRLKAFSTDLYDGRRQLNGSLRNRQVGPWTSEDDGRDQKSLIFFSSVSNQAMNT